MFKFLHAADVHLDSPLRGLEGHEDAPVDEIRGAARRAFDNLIEQALAQEVEFLILAGDLFDGDWKDYNTGLFLIDRLARLGKKGIKTFIVSGNHDAASQITKSLRLPDNSFVFGTAKAETIFLEDIGCAIHGQGYKNRLLDENLAQDFPFREKGLFNIGVLHTSLNGRPGHDSYAPCSLADLLSKEYDYWALGHVHQREIVSETPYVVFPGCLQGRHVKETGPKGATLVTVEDGQIVNLSHIVLDVLRWVDCLVDVSQSCSFEETLAKIKKTMVNEKQINDDMVIALRLMVKGLGAAKNGPAEIEQLVEEIRGLTVEIGEIWLEKVVVEDSGEAKEISAPEIEFHSDLFSSLKISEEIWEGIPELAALKNKLPVKLQSGEDSVFPETTEQMEKLSREVKGLLECRLMNRGSRHDN